MITLILLSDLTISYADLSKPEPTQLKGMDEIERFTGIKRFTEPLTDEFELKVTVFSAYLGSGTTVNANELFLAITLADRITTGSGDTFVYKLSSEVLPYEKFETLKIDVKRKLFLISTVASVGTQDRDIVQKKVVYELPFTYKVSTKENCEFSLKRPRNN